jgi:16S rRNA (guanine527-N7)-methyltransferase
MTLLLRWNRRISLTTITDPTEIVKFHFGESIFAASVIPINVGRLADVGTGAGFPGLPLKIVRPGLSLTLIEANSKKCAFLEEVVRSLELDNVEIIHDRMESIGHPRNSFDFITARAVGQMDQILQLCENALTPEGNVVMWLGEDDALDVRSTNPKWEWREPVHIPGSQRRFLLIGSAFA